MSPQLIARSDDLLRLREDGFHVEVRGAVLLVHDVPYVTPVKVVARGTLVTELELSGDATVQPANHVTYFVGEVPSTAAGNPLTSMIIGSQPTNVGTVAVNHTFSKKPQTDGQRYRDYHHKITTYIALLSQHARDLDPDVTAQTFPVITPDENDDSPFEYIDTATTRAGITEIAQKLRTGPVAIVGLGGTGGYVLDQIAKTPVVGIHLYDGDRYVQHTAFRSPGAAAIDVLRTLPQKVDYYADVYSRMRKGIVPHDTFVTEDNVHELRDMVFVFLTLDDGPSRKMIVAKLEEFGVPFIDVGIGVERVDDALLGLVRTTLSTPEARRHVHDNHRVPFRNPAGANDYRRNIQIADLNMLNAALAVIRWKKYVGFYTDLENEHHSVYMISGNSVINEDQA
jgi:hypothetical protein